jgi:hypothetical protein
MKPLLVACIAFPAAAQPLAITNFSFEDPVLTAGGFSVPPTPVPGWTDVPPTTGNWGVFYPTVGTWGYSASLGHQLLYTNGRTLEHITPHLAQSGATYTLRIDVINRPGYNNPPYFIELYAGATLLARDNDSLQPPVGGFLTSILRGTVPAPAAGQPIKIRVSGQTQTNFDNVRLSLGDCYANCDGSVTPPVLNIADFSCFLNNFAAGNPYANCDDSTTPPVLNIADFSCFLNRFAAGCT